MALLRTSLRPTAQIVSALIFSLLVLIFGFQYYDLVSPNADAIPISTPNRVGSHNNPTLQSLQPIALGARYFIDYPLSPPYKDVFGELGQRARLVRSWIEELQALQGNHKNEAVVTGLVEQLTLSLFPYLKPLHKNGAPDYSPPLADIRNRLGLPTNKTSSSTAGIVIPAGDKNLRFACHLIASLTRIHKTKLPIQVVYAGDKDLSTAGRQKLQAAGDGREIELLDVLTIFDDNTLQLAKGGWAIKPFAALASRFNEVILLDADTVFFQDPQQFLQQDRYRETGVLLFHDRLLWKNGFAERQDWWHEQIKNPGKETAKSLVWTERYSEEGDSGVVVINKSRLEVLIGLLHIGWQNSHDVREEWTYKITYGDKETWWIGFEATESTYAFSPHYGGMVGWVQVPEEEEKPEGEKPEEEKPEEEKPEEKKTERDDQSNQDEKESKTEETHVCSFVIAHVDQKDKLLWYNGGLLKNKKVNQTEFEVPTHWMIDQKWIKGGTRDQMSCMVGTKYQELTSHEKDTLGRSIDLAKEIDEKLGLL